MSIKPSQFKSIPRQAVRLEERHQADFMDKECCGQLIKVYPGVFQTAADTELMVESVQIGKHEDFLEIGCGTGIVSLMLALKAECGVGVDINEAAVKNSQLNGEKLNVKNVSFLESDVFDQVKGMFDVLICNPPYTKHAVRDNIERMFWDPEDEMKRKFFAQADNYLKPNGRIYFGWANFADIDIDLPFKLAEINNFKLINIFSKLNSKHDFNLYVLEFIKK